MAKKLVVMDVDSTFIVNEQIDLLAEVAGVGEQVAAITAEAMAGNLDFSASLARRVALLEGLDDAAFTTVRSQLELNDGVAQFVAEATERGWVLGLISGGFHNILDPFIEGLPISFLRANTLEVHDGRLTGRTIGPIIDQEAKARGLQEYAQEYGIALADTIAIGDGANDRSMVVSAGTGVSFHGKAALSEVADVVIPSGPLTQLFDYLG